MLSRWSLLLFAFVALAGAAAACDGLSPGDQISVGNSLCTLGFLVADENGLYFTTAGHCVDVDDVVSSPDFPEWGVGVYHYLEPESGDLPMSGGAPGEDFGLVRVKPDAYPSLNPKMCGWDGPVGLYEGGADGTGVRHYGHGIILGDLPQTRAREGFFLRTTEDAFYWTGFGVSGDSGSAVMTSDNLAVGVFTHGQYGVTTEDNGGTRLQRGFALAAQAGFLNLRLIVMGEDPVQVLNELRAAPPATAEEPTATTPTGTTPASPTPSTPTGSTARPPPANGTQPETVADDSIAPAATSDEGDAAGRSVPAPWPLAFVALGVLALARRRKE